MPDPAEDQLAATIAAIREGGRQWSALAGDRQAAARAADRRTCWMISLLCVVVMLGAVTACAMTLTFALRGTGLVVPIVIALFGLSGALPLYAAASAMPRLRIAPVVARGGRSLFLGSALGTVLAGALVAVNGTPPAAIVGIIAGAAVVVPAALGGRLISLLGNAGAEA